MILRDYQIRTVRQTHDAINNGHDRICLCLPTGAGKTVIVCELIRDFLMAGLNVVLCTNRTMLIEQLEGS